MGPKFVVAQLVKHGPKDSLVWQVLVLALKLDQPDLDFLCAAPAPANIEALYEIMCHILDMGMIAARLHCQEGM